MSVSSSLMLPGPPAADRLISPDAVTVPVKVGALKVKPEIVVTVAPDAILVEPRVGAEYEATVPQDEVLPSVVKYLPELPVWLGTT